MSLFLAPSLVEEESLRISPARTTQQTLNTEELNIVNYAQW